MKRLLRLAPAVLAGFIAEVVIPRAALIAHDHPGGAAPHVHLWAFADEADHDHDDHPHPHAHPHRHRPTIAHDAGHAPTLQALRHVHVPQPYQRADRPPLPTVGRVDRVISAAPAVSQTPPAGTLPLARSRGPPRVAA